LSPTAAYFDTPAQLGVNVLTAEHTGFSHARHSYRTAIAGTAKRIEKWVTILAARTRPGNNAAHTVFGRIKRAIDITSATLADRVRLSVRASCRPRPVLLR
jgi:hypothetical protein